MTDPDAHRRYSLHMMQEICEILQLKMVPIEEEKDSFDYDTVDMLLERAKGKYPSSVN